MTFINLEPIREIFKEIDNAIKESISKEPVRLSDSKFIKKYEEIKNKWLR